MPVVTDVLHSLAEHPDEATVPELARSLHRRPEEVLSALSVLEAQGLALRGRNRYDLTKLGRRIVRPAEPPRIAR